MQTLPLIAHDRPDAVVAWRAGESISAAQFLRDTATLAARLPDGRHLLNLCGDRYHFMLALAAGLLRDRCNLLPSTQAPEVIRHLHALAPDMTCLVDARTPAAVTAPLRCPILRVAADASDAAPRDAQSAAPGVDWTVPRIPVERLAALIFTSGSTGTPVPHVKRFGALVDAVRVGATRLAPIGHGGCAILGTVPPQHMYGFESTVLMPMQTGGALCAQQPLFPADIGAALQQLPRPRALISTPVHLRALVEADIALPPLDVIVSATAMLAEELAHQVERRLRAPLMEIYGSTETGQIASRRPVQERSWHLWPGVRLAVDAERWFAEGAHLSGPTPLADLLEPLDAGRFLLHGRTADLVNVAGKRSSLAYLSHQLNAIPGVLDGAFFVHDDARASIAGVTRLAALAVAPGLGATHIIAALRERIDPVFLPRPLLLVERLPRNATGKLPQRALHALAAELAAATPELFE